MCSLGVNGGGPEARRSMPGQLKPDESWVEDRTVADLQIARRSTGIGVKVQSSWAIAGSNVKLLVSRRP